MVADNRFDLDLLDGQDPFEIDAQAAHLFKHPHLGVEDVWASDPLFYPAKPPAHWLMCAEVSAGCWWCRWHRHVTAIHSAAARSAVTWPPRDLLLSTAGTDEQQHADDT